VVLYEMLTGQVPFDADSEYELMRRIVEEEPRDVLSLSGSLPGGLSAVVKTALAKDPANRFPSCDAMRQALLRGVQAREPEVPERSVSPAAPASDSRAHVPAPGLSEETVPRSPTEESRPPAAATRARLPGWLIPALVVVVIVVAAGSLVAVMRQRAAETERIRAEAAAEVDRERDQAERERQRLEAEKDRAVAAERERHARELRDLEEKRRTAVSESVAPPAVQSGQNATAFNIAGTWVGMINEPGQEDRRIELRVRQYGTREWTAKLTTLGGISITAPVRDMTFEHGRLAFTVDRQGSANRFAGTLVGDVVAGAVERSGGRMASFTLKRAEESEGRGLGSAEPQPHETTPEQRQAASPGTPQAEVAVRGLESFLIQEVALRGVVRTTGGYIAILLGGDGRSYFVTAGHPLRDGEVAEVLPTAVVFRQGAPSSAGGPSTRLVRKSLYSQGEAAEVSDGSDPPVVSQAPSEQRVRQSVAGTPSPSLTGGFAVVPGAFKDRQSADAVVRALKARAYPAYVVAPTVGKGLFMVRVGPYVERADAESVQKQLREEGFNPFIIRQ
jgi:peptidoglycan hydrolase-like protein with peptidoglycan-binding domain